MLNGLSYGNGVGIVRGVLELVKVSRNSTWLFNTPKQRGLLLFLGVSDIALNLFVPQGHSIYRYGPLAQLPARFAFINGSSVRSHEAYRQILVSIADITSFAFKALRFNTAGTYVKNTIGTFDVVHRLCSISDRFKL